MSEMQGWKGVNLRIDLTDRKITKERIDPQLLRMYVGGKGLGARMLYDEVGPDIEPFSPQNLLMLLTGPLQGTKLATSTRYVFVTKSPETGIYLDSHVSGHVGYFLKLAGYDLITIKGRADRPAYISVLDERVEIRDASHIWGKPVFEAEGIIESETDKRPKVAAIGPAGEKLVKFACVTSERVAQAGRGGVGAVFGSKNLKAIAVHGTGSVPIANESGAKEIVRTWIEKLADHYNFHGMEGTPYSVRVANSFGMFPTRNFESGFFEEYEKISSKILQEKHFVAKDPCMFCPVSCRRISAIREGKYAGTTVGGPEYETIGLLGGSCGISDMNAIIYAAYLCDALGLDTISTGNVIGFAMECFKRGLLSTKDTEGIKLEFGNSEAMIAMVENIAYRRGIGDLLAEGVKTASERMGGIAPNVAVHVKGLEVPAWDPRGRLCFGLTYAVADVGGSHLRGWPDTTDPPTRSGLEKVASIVKAKDEKVMKDSLIICHFSYQYPATADELSKMLSYVTGVNYNVASYYETGKRIETLTRLYDVREGVDRRKDVLPPRLMEPEAYGPARGNRAFISQEDFEACVTEYYKLRGWNAEGIPEGNTVRSLRIGH